MLATFLRRLRHRRWQHGRPPSLHRSVLWLLAMVALFAAAMAALEAMPPEESLWLAVVTLTTVGYGDVVAKTPAGKLATVLLLMAGGVFVLAKLASDWFEWRDTVRERKRRGFWRWDMHDHVLIVGTPAGEGEAAARFFAALVRQLQGTTQYRDAPVELLTRAFDARPEGLPQALCDIGVVHRSGAPTDPDALEAADAGRAAAVVVLADAPEDPVSDAVAMDVLARVRALAEAAGRAMPPVVVECVDDRNRRRLLAAGAAATVRPLRTYPEMLARALVAPGAERLLEDLFTPEGNELHRVPLDRPWRGRWAELACAVLRADLGTAIACEAPDGEVTLNPRGSQEVVASALFLVLQDGQESVLAARLPGALRAALVADPAAPAAVPA